MDPPSLPHLSSLLLQPSHPRIPSLAHIQIPHNATSLAKIMFLQETAKNIQIAIDTIQKNERQKKIQKEVEEICREGRFNDAARVLEEGENDYIPDLVLPRKQIMNWARTTKNIDTKRRVKIFSICGEKQEAITLILQSTRERIRDAAKGQAENVYPAQMAAIYDAHVACMHDEMVSSFPEEVTKICVESSLDVEVQVSLVIDSFTERRQIDRKIAESREGKSDLKEFDLVLQQLMHMIARTNGWQRFLTQNNTSLPEGISTRIRDLEASYTVLETSFLSLTLQKAIKMDAWHAADYTSSAVDDVFYILRKCIMRSLHTGWLSADRMIKASLGVLEEEYIGVMEKRLKSTKTNLKHLNNVEVSCSYIIKLHKELEGEASQLYPDENTKIKSTLSSLMDSSLSFKGTLKNALDSHFSTVIGPQLRSLLEGVLKEINYTSGDQEYEDLNAVGRRMIPGLTKILAQYKTDLTEPNLDFILSREIEYITKAWERIALACKFSQLGALRFDKDVRTLLTYFASNATWNVREKFLRLLQISSVLSLPSASDVYDIWSPQQIEKLSAADIRKFLALRFTEGEVNQLVL